MNNSGKRSKKWKDPSLQLMDKTFTQQVKTNLR